MHIAVCLDDRDGMLFNKRRLSTDKAVTQRLLEQAGNGCLWMNGYSAKLFPENADCVCTDERFLEKAGAEDICFVENMDVTPYLPEIKTVTIYRWNRRYPSDMKFPTAQFSYRWQLVSRTDFAGSTHEKITQEVYAL